MFFALPCQFSHHGDLKSVTECSTSSYDRKSIVLIAGLIFSTASWTLAGYVPGFAKMHDPQVKMYIILRSAGIGMSLHDSTRSVKKIINLKLCRKIIATFSS